MTNYSDFNKGLLKHNAIINGNFNIWQRGTAFSGSTQYVADAWLAGETLATGVASFSAETTNRPLNSLYALKATMTTSQASPGASEYLYIKHHIEGYNAMPLYKKQCVLSFWVYSNHPGTYSVFVRSASETTSYVKDFTIDSASTWEYKVIPVDLNDTAGSTWTFSNTRSMSIGFCLFSGTTFKTSTLGQWVSGNYICSTNVPNTFQQTVDNVFILSQVQLEIGSVATPFDHIPINQEILDCFRYYQKIVVNHATGTYVQTGAGTIYSDIYINKMRAAPSLSMSGQSMWWAGAWTTPTSIVNCVTSADRVRLVFQTTNTGYTIGTSGLIVATLYLSSNI